MHVCDLNYVKVNYQLVVGNHSTDHMHGGHDARES